MAKKKRITKSKDGDIAIITFPKLTVNVSEAEEFGYGGRDRWGNVIAPKTIWKAEYQRDQWVCPYPEIDETIYAKTIPELLRKIKETQKDDALVKKVGPVNCRIER